jgi:hypothetical protein
MPIPATPASTSTTTLAEWIEETRDHIDGDNSEEANQLDGAYVAGSGTLTLQHPMGNIAPGAWLSIRGNTLRVMDTAGQTATVVGGQRGSHDANAADNTMVRVNPRFSDFQIIRAINRTLGAISSPEVGLYRVLTVDLENYNPAMVGYELDDPEMARILDVRREAYGGTLMWESVPAEHWDLVWGAPTVDFPSGIALRLLTGNPGLATQVVYGTVYDTIDSVDALASTTGISEQAEDIPPMGAALRLVAPREIGRNATRGQGSSRRSNEVPPGAVGASYRGLAAFYQQRLDEESSRLRQKWPVGW